ncbi:MAG: recombinase family protein, partial [Candidatus Pacebacteria bacterium]|nr:recombinase family protein [Candidatus Paceibacterota bacterium]
MKSVSYCRVSSREQEETGYSLPAQNKLLKEYSERNKFKVTKTFSISESASGSKQRKVFYEMLLYLKENKIDILLCEKVDRLTRNLKDAVAVNDWLEENTDRQIHFVKQNLVIHKNAKSDDKFRWDIEIVLAKKYISNLSEEVKKGQSEKIAQGWLPTAPPPGYITIGEKGHKTHIINNNEAIILKKIFKIYATGNYSLKRLVEITYKKGLRNKLNNKIGLSQIHRLMSNPFYIGKIRWNSKIYQGKHEPIISEEIFNKVQDVLHNKKAPKFTRHNYLFNSLIKCGECGGLITWEKQKSFIYGHCNRYKSCSQKKYFRDDMIEEQLLEEVEKISIKSPALIAWVIKALKESHKDESAYHNSVVEELNNKMATIKHRLDKSYEDKLDEIISKDKYLELRNKFETEEKEIIKTLSKHKKANLEHYDYGLLVLDVIKNSTEIL